MNIMFRNLARRHPRIAAALWFALAAAILPGIIALGLSGTADGSSALSRTASMYVILTNPLAFAMLFVSRGLKGEEYMWLLMLSPLLSAALAGAVSGASILRDDPITPQQAGKKGIAIAYATYFINGITGIPLAYLVAEGAMNWGELPVMLGGGTLMLVFSLFIASLALIPMGFGSGHLLHTFAGTAPPPEPADPLP